MPRLSSHTGAIKFTWCHAGKLQKQAECKKQTVVPAYGQTLALHLQESSAHRLQ